MKDTRHRCLCPKLCVEVHCRDIEKGRIFTGSDVFRNDAVDLSTLDISSIQPGTMYYVDEKENGESTHPLGDIFFVSSRNELVLIDITASSETSSAMNTKKKHSRKFLEAYRRDESRDQKIIVVIISPFANGQSRESSETSGLWYVYGEEAKKLLGGLVQFLAWY